MRVFCRPSPKCRLILVMRGCCWRSNRGCRRRCNDCFSHPFFCPPRTFTSGTSDCRSLGFPRFPVELGGVDEPHAAFLNESRTRGRVESSAVGNPGSLGMTKRAPAVSFSFVAGIDLLTKMRGRLLGGDDDGCLPEGGFLSGWVEHGNLAVVFSGRYVLQGDAEAEGGGLQAICHSLQNLYRLGFKEFGLIAVEGYIGD